MEDNKEMVFGEGDVSIEIPNPLSVDHKTYNFDYYCAMAAAGLFALTDPEQFPNSDDAATKIVNRAKIFGNKVRGAFPGAFS